MIEVDSDVLASLKEIERRIYQDGDFIVIMVTEVEPYEIAVEACRTHAQILRWVNHLCEKNWMNRRLVRRFSEVATKAAGIDLY